MFSNDPQTLLIVLGSIIVSMSFHEAMHAFTGHWLGDTTAYEEGRLTLNPLKHIDIFTTVLLPVILLALGLAPFFIAKPVPFNPNRIKYGEFGVALVGIVGPLTNLFLAVTASLIIRSSGIAVGTQWFSIMGIFVAVNISFFVFNMIPFPPLDGSRLLFAFAPEPLQKLMLRIESAGFMSILIFMLLIFQFISPIVLSVSTGLLNLLLG